MLGVRYASRCPGQFPATQSGLRPLPYFPNVKRQVRSTTAAVVMSYFEIYCPSRQDSSGVLLSDAVTVDLGRVSADLQLGRRTLYIAICILATRWKD